LTQVVTSKRNVRMVLLVKHHYCTSNQIALFVACQNGHYDVVKTLLEHGSRTEVQYNFGLTPLQQAAAKTHKSIVQLLIQYGARYEFLTTTPSTHDLSATALPQVTTTELTLNFVGSLL
jgi:ankyrin repeat protein